MRVTIKDIAEELRVSPVTVSRGLNNTGRMSAATRTRILRTATSLGYRPNAAARAMVSGKFNQVGLVLGVDSTRSHLPSGLLYGVHDALMESGINLTVTRLSDEQLSSDGFVPMILKQTSADGLLVNYRSGMPAPLMTLIRQHTIPSIWIESAQSNDGVNIDHFDGAEFLTRNLLELGHRRIAYVDHYPDDAQPSDGLVAGWHYSISERRRGYASAMGLAGLSPRFIHRPPGNTVPNRVSLAKEWLSQSDRPTAVVGYVPATAWPVIMAAQSLGLRVPYDISVVTFSDDNLTGVQLTGMALPERELGRQGVRMLLEKIEHPTRVLPSIRLKAEFLPGTTAAPPSA